MKKLQNSDDFEYNAFISYNGKTGEIAKTLFLELSKLKLPQKAAKRTRLKIFWDKGAIRTGDELSETISKAIHNSEFFILIASKSAAKSKWVAKEVELWLEKEKDASEILFVIADGIAVWDQENGDFNWKVTDCIPRLLEKKCSDTCRENLSEISIPAKNKKEKEILQYTIASIGSKLLNVSQKAIISHERKRQRYFRFAVITTAFVLCTLFFSSVYSVLTKESYADKLYDDGLEKLKRRKNWNDIQLAIADFDAALAIDPNHIKALLTKADAHILLVGFGKPITQTVELQEAQNNFDRAESLIGRPMYYYSRFKEGFGNSLGIKTQNTVAEYYRVKGRLLLYKERNILGARKNFEKALEIDPNKPEVLHNLASTFTFLGQHEEAKKICQKALDLVLKDGNGRNDSRFIQAKIQLAWIYYYAGEFQLARQEIDDISERETPLQANKYLAYISLQIGNYSEAVKRFEKADADNIVREPNFYPIYSCARMLAGEISKSEALNNIKSLPSKVGGVSHYRIAQGYACIGEANLALEQVKKARDHYDIFVPWSAVDPIFFGLKQDPEFQDYLRSVGFNNENAY